MSNASEANKKARLSLRIVLNEIAYGKCREEKEKRKEENKIFGFRSEIVELINKGYSDEEIINNLTLLDCSDPRNYEVAKNVIKEERENADTIARKYYEQHHARKNKERDDEDDGR